MYKLNVRVNVARVLMHMDQKAVAVTALSDALTNTSP